MAERPPLRVPDPSATIPDFALRPDAADVAKIARAKALQDERDGVAPAPPKAKRKKRKGLHPLIIAALVLVVAVIFGGFGFVFALFIGVLAWLLFLGT